MLSDQKTSLLLTAASRQAYQMAKAGQPDLTMQEFVNSAIAHYSRHQHGPNLDPLMLQVRAIHAAVDQLLARPSAPTIPAAPVDHTALVAALVAALRPQISAISPPVHVPKWRQWLASWRTPKTALHW